MQQPINILEHYWNYTSFKPQQENIINAILDNEDVFTLMPTGGGKSLCFQIPALVRDGICIVISPLIALMKDQVQALQAKGIKAMAITSGISYNELGTALDNCIYGKYKFLYLSPERLQQELVQIRIRQMNVNLIAIDEAHCISQWGNDFRPAYKNIKVLRELQPGVNDIAVTASATPEVAKDIITELDFIDAKIFKHSFERKNLGYMTFETEDKYYKLEQILKKQNAPAIVYVRNRRATKEISRFLEDKGFTSTFFHGGLSNKEKEDKLNLWLNNNKHIMVATNAFGMGIDKPDVKTVIHFNLPESLESYFQESGRAGRNGKKAFAVLLKNASDSNLLKNQFLKVLPSVAFVKQVYRKLCNYFQISYGEGAYTTFDFNFNLFCNTYNFNTILAFNAFQILDRTSVINLTKQFNKLATLQFIVNDTQVFEYINKHPETNIIIKSLLRTYGGIFEHQTTINTIKISEKASITEDVLLKTLNQLHNDNIIEFQYSTTDASITFIEPREDDKTINRIAKVINQQNDLKKTQIESVIKYIENDSVCKSMQLLTYFGEKNLSPCGNCSVCIRNKPNNSAPDIKTIKDAIILVLEQDECSSRKLSEILPFSEDNISETIKVLLEHNIITITNTNTYKLAHI